MGAIAVKKTLNRGDDGTLNTTVSRA